jgi:homoserine O-acetyltransferase
MYEETVAIGSLALDCGATLPAVEQRVTMYGTPSPDGSNVVLVAHALTGSSRVAEWWPGIVGEGSLFDLRDWCAIGINALGSCYGSTGAAARISVRDIVRAEMRALDRLGMGRRRLAWRNAGSAVGGRRAKPSRRRHNGRRARSS